MSSIINKYRTALNSSPLALAIKRIFPRWTASRLYKYYFGRKINWQNPTEFNEKIRWIQFNTDTSRWTLLADKFLVRKYLEDRGYGNMLVKLYGVWENAEEIDFDQLPESFVLKTNHGSGGVYVVKDKSKVNLNQIKKDLNHSLSETFGVQTAEPHYFPIKPLIIAEEVLTQDGNVSKDLIDYKFFCINGNPQFCAVMYNRDIDHHTYDVRLYDIDWNDISHLLGKYKHTKVGSMDIPVPKTFEQMKKFCLDVCKDFPFVRMDFYETNGKLYFGEFTFTPAACTGAPLGIIPCNILSEKLILPEKTK